MELDEFIDQNEQHETTEPFELENPRLLDVDIDSEVIAKANSMVAYEGELTFTGITNAEGGLKGYLKKKTTGEGGNLMRVTGTGSAFLADQGKHIQLIKLDSDESISVNGTDILAFQHSITYKIGTIGSLSGISSGGLTNVFLEGPGYIAITTQGSPIVLTPPVRTDPNATVAWSSNLSPSSHIDSNLGDFIGQNSGETYQLEFTGDSGFVVVQPHQEGLTR